MAIARQSQAQAEMKLRAGIGLASLFVVGCFCVAVLMSGSQTNAAENDAVTNAALAQHGAAQ